MILAKDLLWLNCNLAAKRRHFLSCIYIDIRQNVSPKYQLVFKGDFIYNFDPPTPQSLNPNQSTTYTHTTFLLSTSRDEVKISSKVEKIKSIEPLVIGKNIIESRKDKID